MSILLWSLNYDLIISGVKCLLPASLHSKQNCFSLFYIMTGHGRKDFVRMVSGALKFV